MACTITSSDNLPPIPSGSFSYGINGLQYNNISRIPLDELKGMFKPKRGQARTDTRGYKMSKKDIEAQLQLYGVPCSGMGSLRVAEMRDILAEMVKTVESPSDEVTKLETCLKEKYTSLNTAHIKSLAETRQAEFDAITDPTLAANYSIPLFLRRYFLNDDGTPDPTKTTHPLALPGFENWEMMHEATSKIEGLNTSNEGQEPNRVLVIGWDSGAVRCAASEAAAGGHHEPMNESEKEGNDEQGGNSEQAGIGEQEMEAEKRGNGEQVIETENGGNGEQEIETENGGNVEQEMEAEKGGNGEQAIEADNGGNGEQEMEAEKAGNGEQVIETENGGNGEQEMEAEKAGNGEQAIGTENGGNGEQEMEVEKGGNGEQEIETENGGNGEQQSEPEEESNPRMDEHRQFLKSLKSQRQDPPRTRSRGKLSEESNLSQVAGRYLVECKHIQEQWPDQAENGLYMKIAADKNNKERMVAEFEFGILEGIMRFSQVGEEHLPEKERRRDLDWEEEGESTEVDSYGEPEELDEESEEEADEEDRLEEIAISFLPDFGTNEDDIDEYLYTNTRKRKRKSSPPATTAKKHHSEPTFQSTESQSTQPTAGGANPPPVKKTRLSPLKLLFLWRGRETGEGEIQVDYDRSNQGHIEFDNMECTTFTGIMDSQYFTNAELKGYKVAKDDGRGIKYSWEQFSEKSYQRSRVTRW